MLSEVPEAFDDAPDAPEAFDDAPEAPEGFDEEPDVPEAPEVPFDVLGAPDELGVLGALEVPGVFDVALLEPAATPRRSFS